MDPNHIALQMRNIDKSFTNVKANRNIDFTLLRGEVHALLGENGAGKTTLMKILYGLYKPDSGEIFLNGVKTEINSPEHAIHKGIGMVHQHFMLIPPFTVLENIVLGSEPRRSLGRLDRNAALRKISALSEKLGLKIDPHAKVEDISVGLQQRVEILKALYREAEILILDEPTSVLTPQEVDELGQILRKLVAQGKSIVFITHKLKEVMKFADRITVIRQGQVIGTVESKQTDMPTLAEMMVGRKIIFDLEKKPLKTSSVIIQTKDLCAENNRRIQALKGVDLEVRAGEILAIAGIDGNGQSELIEVLTGLRPATRGSFFLENRELTNHSPKEIIEAGVGHIPEDRQKRGLVLDFSILENIILENYRNPEFCSYGWINHNECRIHAEKLIQEFDIRTPDQETKVQSLSGGNQQKVILAREIRRKPKFLIVAQPTRGLDIGAIEFVHRQLLAERDQGTAILLLSLELDEVLALADRIAVIYEGKIMGVLSREKATEEVLGLMMTGGIAPIDQRKEGACHE